MQPLILTLKLDSATFEFFDSLRKRHFPPARNFLPAHVTLFHALPGEDEPEIRKTLRETAREIKTLELNFPTVRFLGKGVAIDLESPELVALREHYRRLWQTKLTAQDNQKGFRPHVTIQNKVEPAAARNLFEETKQSWKPLEGKGEGLLLWRYLGGPWELIEEFQFQADNEKS